MNQREATMIVGWLNRGGLLWAMEGQGEVWADALQDVPFETAFEVAKTMVRERTSTSRAVVPADIRAKVEEIRKQRIAVMAAPQPPETLDGHTRREIEWRKAYVRHIGDGLSEAEADRRACAEVGVVRPDLQIAPRPVTAVLEGHKAACGSGCGCLTRPVRREEGLERPGRAR